MKKNGTSSTWPVEKDGEASARQLETIFLGRLSRHYSTPLVATPDIRA
jgi:Leucine-rich repeat (LRR) protein